MVCEEEGPVPSTFCTGIGAMQNLGALWTDATSAWCYMYDIIGAESCEGSYIRYVNEHTPEGGVNYQQCYTDKGRCKALDIMSGDKKYEVVEFCDSSCEDSERRSECEDVFEQCCDASGCVPCSEV